jgi:tetratricopeptide (TPR) repeat protein
MSPIKMARLFFIIISGFLVLQPFQAYAHIEKGYMPDAVAEMEYKILLEFEPDNIEIRNKLGMVLYQQDKLIEAAKEFNRVLKKDPDNFDAIDALGLIMAKKKQYNQAMALYQKAISLNPDDVLVYYHLGQSLEAANNFTAAADAYRKALEKNEKAGDEVVARKRTEMLNNALKNINQLQKTAK